MHTEDPDYHHQPMHRQSEVSSLAQTLHKNLCLRNWQGVNHRKIKNKYKRSLVWWKLSSHSNTKSRSETKSVQLEKGCGLRLWLTDSSSPWNKQPKLRCQLCLFISLSLVPHLKQQHSSPHSFYSRQECYCHSYICGLWVNVVIQITTALAFYKKITLRLSLIIPCT